MTDESQDTPEEEARPGLTDRRKVLIGGAVGAAALATGVALLADRGRTPPIKTELTAKRVAKVPATEPDSGQWSHGSTIRVELDGQAMAQPMRPKPSHPYVDVTALYDDDMVAFRVEWPDDERDDLTIACDAFRDSCAVLLAPDATDAALRIMGTADVPVTLLHWKADWQRDIDDGYQDPKVEFPNASFDYYPPLPAGTDEGVTFADYEKAKATMWLPGLHAGNPLSVAKRTTPVEKLIARGFGTATTQATQDAQGAGVWRDGHWSVVVAKARTATDDGELTIKRGPEYGVALAVWSGAENDGGSRKSPSKALLTFRLAS